MDRRQLLAGLAITGAKLFAAEPPALTPANLSVVEKLVQGELLRTSTPGLTIAIASGREQRWAKGFGFADLENDVPAAPRTVYRLASISKTITAVAVMQLVEKGLIDLDAPVQRYVPSFPVKPQPVTTRLLLGHLAGIRHYQHNEIASTRYFPSVAEALAVFAGDPLIADPGTKYIYTTYGYVLLGAVVEGASGQPYGEYVRRNIFEKAAMEHSQVDSVYQIIPHRTRGYIKNAAGAVLNCGLADTSNKVPGGGWSSTAGD